MSHIDRNPLTGIVAKNTIVVIRVITGSYLPLNLRKMTRFTGSIRITRQ